jgi:hypothetical protein
MAGEDNHLLQGLSDHFVFASKSVDCWINICPKPSYQSHWFNMFLEEKRICFNKISMDHLLWGLIPHVSMSSHDLISKRCMRISFLSIQRVQSSAITSACKMQADWNMSFSNLTYNWSPQHLSVITVIVNMIHKNDRNRNVDAGPGK